MRLIEESRAGDRSQGRSLEKSGNYSLDWEDYHPHDVLNEFIQALADANDFARIIPIGHSYEGREMNVLAIEKVSEGLVTMTTLPARRGLERPASGWRPAYTPGSGSPQPWPPSS